MRANLCCAVALVGMMGMMAKVAVAESDSSLAPLISREPQSVTSYNEELPPDQLALLDTGCGAIPSDSVLQKLGSLESVHPLSKEQAKSIAQAYFSHVYGVCGAMLEPTETKTEWIFPTMVGVAAAKAEPIRVLKATGGIQCERHESFATIGDFVQHLLTCRSSGTPQKPA